MALKRANGEGNLRKRSNGTWEAMFDMSRLPEGGDFQITAEYMDVNGPSAAMTACTARNSR